MVAVSSAPGEVLRTIASLVSDYRREEIAPITTGDVDHWISQFAPDDQQTVLEETAFLLDTCYLSRAKTEALVRLFAAGLFDDDPDAARERFFFLPARGKGASQFVLRQIVDSVLRDKYGFGIDACGGAPDTFVYLDDCLFSGNTALGDMRPLIGRLPSHSTLLMVFFALFSSGLDYFFERIRTSASSGPQRIEYWPLMGTEFANNKNKLVSSRRYECLWPCEFPDDPSVDAYVAHLREECGRQHGFVPGNLFRPECPSLTPAPFSSQAARGRVERAFLQAGVEILCGPNAPRSPYLRPLGYEKLFTLGFGSPFVTYRNVPNNCPLALWWGVGNWKPLLPRRPNDDQ